MSKLIQFILHIVQGKFPLPLKNIVTKNNRLAEDKKFINQFNYFEYNIEEIIDGNRAKVIFNNKNKSDRVQSIVYHLNLTDTSKN